MPTAPLQQSLAVFEIALLLVGVVLAFRLARSPDRRARWLGPGRMASWQINLPEFGLYLLLIITGGVIGQSAVRGLLGNAIARAHDRSGWEVFAYGAGIHGGALLGWLLFPFFRRRFYSDYGTIPAPEVPAPARPARNILYCAAGTLLLAQPLLLLLSLGWTFLLRKLGLPDEPQELIAIFANTQSPFAIAGMLLVACVLAPLNEELIFRAGLYRFCRQKLGRPAALLLSGGLFGALHLNLAGFLPLALLGILLALAYDATGDIRVSVVAHGLFNFNTILVILSGLQQ